MTPPAPRPPSRPTALGRTCMCTLALCASPAWAATATTVAEGVWNYEIEPGDTLIGISQRLLVEGFDWRRLQRLNKVVQPRRLLPGRSLRIPLDWLRGEAAEAVAVHVHGEVDRIAAGGRRSALARGERLRTGDIVECGAQASATLRFEDGSRLLVTPGSRLVLSQLQKNGRTDAVATRLRLERGHSDAHVEPQAGPRRRFELNTPTVHLGVRGTDFRAHVAGDVTHSEVLTGRIAAGAASVMEVPAGYGLVAVAGQALSAPLPLPVAPRLDDVPERVERVPLRLAWPAVPGALAYRAQVFAAGDADRLLLDAQVDQASVRWSDLPDGRYRLRVRAIDAAGLEGLDADREFTLDARPEPPFIQDPPPAAKLRGDTATLSWTRAVGAVGYRVQIAALDTPLGTAQEHDRLADNQLVLSLPAGEYQWWVASVDVVGKRGPYGDAQRFSLVPVPAAPTAEAAELGEDVLVLRWRSGQGGQTYVVQIARDEGFAQLLHEMPVAQNSLRLPRPEPGRYHLRVRTVDPDGFGGPFGAVQIVEVPPRPSGWWWVPGALMLLKLAL